MASLRHASFPALSVDGGSRPDDARVWRLHWAASEALDDVGSSAGPAPAPRTGEFNPIRSTPHFFLVALPIASPLPFPSRESLLVPHHHFVSMTLSGTQFKHHRQTAALPGKRGRFGYAQPMAVPDTFGPRELNVCCGARRGDRHEASRRT